MDRFTNRRVLLAKIQSAHNTDPVPTPAANAILIYDLDVKPLVATRKERRPIRPFFGGMPALLADQHVAITFKVDFAGAGAAGTAPAWGPLVRACATAEVITPGVKVEYTPIIDNQEEIAFYYYNDGVVHKVIDCRGDCAPRLVNNDWPQLAFTFIGRKAGRVAAGVPSGSVFTSWIEPLIVNDINTGDITLGGVSYPSKGLEFGFGNKVGYKAMLGKEGVRISDRTPTAKFSLDLTGAQELTLMSQIEASGTSTFAITHGTTAGNIVSLSAPALQLFDPTEENDDDALLFGYAGEAKPSAGNDEFKITVQ